MREGVDGPPKTVRATRASAQRCGLPTRMRDGSLDRENYPGVGTEHRGHRSTVPDQYVWSGPYASVPSVLSVPSYTAAGIYPWPSSFSMAKWERTAPRKVGFSRYGMPCFEATSRTILPSAG